MKGKWSITTLLAIVASSLLAWSGDGEYPFGKMDDRVTTPHFDFAKKQAGKPLKVMVSGFGLGQREVIELKQRFAFQQVLLPVLNPENFSPWEGRKKSNANSMSKAEYLEARNKILAQLPSCDAIIIGKSYYDVMPADVREKIFKRVADGAALIWIAPFDKKMNIPGVTLKETTVPFHTDSIPALKGTKVYLGNYGKGKVMEIVYQLPVNELIHPYNKTIPQRTWLEPLTPFESDHPLYYDFCHAFLGKCLLMLTKPENNQIISAANNTVELKQPVKEMKLESTVYNTEGEILFRKTVDASVKNNNLIPADLPRSAAQVLYRLLDAKGNVIDYYNAPCIVNPSNRITSLKLAKDGWKPGEAIRGELQLRNAEKSGELILSVTDEYGRMIHRSVQKSPKIMNTFKIKINHFRSRFGKLKAELRKNGRILDQQYAKIYFNTVDQDRQDFCFSIWSNHQVDSRISKLALIRMREAGVDNVMECTYGGTSYKRKHQIPRWIKEYGLNYSTYITYVRGPAGNAINSKDCKTMSQWEKYQETKTFPWENKKFFMNPTRVMDIADGAAGLGVYFYNLGDENALATEINKENCFCDACQKRFRTYLKKVYGSLDKVNKEYRKSYKSWDEIRAYPFIQSCKKDLGSMWVDFRLFMEEQFIDLHRYVMAQITAKDPEAILGIEGMGPPANSFCGFNFPKMLPYFRFCAPYFTSREIHAMKFLAPDSVRAAWYGTYDGQMSAPIVKRTPWRYLLHGLNGAFWWASIIGQNSPGFNNNTIMRPDMGWLSQFELSAKEISKIKQSGIGKLMVASKPYPSGVAIHYSNNCLHASTLNPGMTNWELALQEFGTALEEAAVSYEYLAPHELEKGVPAHIKVLILPFSQAVSDKECKAIIDFVKNGGLLIADQMPAMMNEHGSFRSNNPLAFLFNGEKLKVKKTGKGFAVLTDDYFRNITTRVAMNSSGGLVRGMRHLLNLVNVKPAVTVTNEYGSICRADIYGVDDLILVGMLGPMEQEIKTAKNVGLEAGQKTVDAIGGSAIRHLTTAQDYYVYDMANGGKLLGKGKQFKIALEPSVGRVLVFSKKAMTAPRISCTKAVKPGQPVKIRIGGNNSCTIIKIIAPDGKELHKFRVRGQEGVYVPAWNEPKGNYQLLATGAVGGMTSTAKFTVQ